MSIEKMKDKYFQYVLYGIAGISKQAFHQHWIKQKRKRHKKMGSRILFYAIKPENIGINKFEQLVASKGYGIVRKRKRIITTQGVHEEDDINLMNGLVLTGVNQAVSGDISYVQCGVQTFYVFTLKDAYSKMIVGLTGSDNMMADNQQCTKS